MFDHPVVPDISIDTNNLVRGGVNKKHLFTFLLGKHGYTII